MVAASNKEVKNKVGKKEIHKDITANILTCLIFLIVSPFASFYPNQNPSATFFVTEGYEICSPILEEFRNWLLWPEAKQTTPEIIEVFILCGIFK